MNFSAHQEKKKNEKTGKKKAEEEEDKRLILKKLRAALVRSFRGHHGKKMICVRGVPGVIRILGEANNHFDPTQMELRTAPQVEVAVDWYSSILLALYTVYTTEVLHFTISED